MKTLPHRFPIMTVLLFLSMIGGFGLVDLGAEDRKAFVRKDAFFGLHFDLHPNAKDKLLGSQVTEVMIENLLQRIRPDYVQYDCKGHPGYTGYPTEVGWSSPGIVADSLLLWRKGTRKEGIGLFIHYSGVWDSKAIEEHPDWARVDEKGKRDRDATSVFGPYVDRLMIPQLKEVIAKYDLDGVWVDGDCWAARLDYSSRARKAWSQATGHKKVPMKPGEPNWQEWKMFHRDAFDRYVQHWTDTLHAWRPTLQITSNWMYSSLVPRPVSIQLDYLSGDYSPSNSVDRAQLEARYLASTGMPWDLMAWGFDKSKVNGWSMKPAVQLQQEASVVLMQGGGFQVYHTPTRSGYIHPDIVDQLEKVAQFCRQRQKWSFQSTSVPQVALLLSAASTWEIYDKVYGHPKEYEEMQGALDAFLDSHFSVDLLAEHQLEKRLDAYPLVIIPNSHKLAPGFRDRLAGYVQKGGSLFLLGEKSARLFPEMPGVRLKETVREENAELYSPEGMANVNGNWLQVETGTARILAEYFPDRDTRNPGKAAVTVQDWGKGKVAVAYGPLALHYYYGHHPSLRKLFAHIGSELLPHPMVKLNAPPTVDMSLRRTKEGKLTLHLFNKTNKPLPDRHNFTDYIPPIGPITVTWRMQQKPEKVQWVPENAEMTWHWENGVLTAVIPSLNIHGILVID